MNDEEIDDNNNKINNNFIVLNNNDESEEEKEEKKMIEDFEDIKEVTDIVNEITYASINQDQNYISLASKNGFKIFSVSPLKLFYENKCGPIKIIEMLNSTNLILLVGQNDFDNFSPRKATIFSIKDNRILCSFWPFLNEITLAKLNKKRIILLENLTIHIFSTNDMEELHTLDIIEININSIALSPSSEKNNFLIYSDSNNEGIIKVYDLLNLTFKNKFLAHKCKLRVVSINYYGNLIVTCSIQGKTIRVFNVPKGEKIYTYKRGIQNAKIYSISFDIDSNNKFVLSSETGTIHIFDLEQTKNENYLNNLNDNKSFMSDLINKIQNNIKWNGYEDLYNFYKPMLSTNFPSVKINNKISFLGGSKSNEIFIINEVGIFQKFSINYKSNKIISETKQILDDLK
jgi:WD40 repeat protein